MLKKVIRMGREASGNSWQRAEYEWTNGWRKHKKILTKILSFKEYDPHELFWKYIKEVRQRGFEKINKEAKAIEEREKEEYIKNIV